MFRPVTGRGNPARVVPPFPYSARVHGPKKTPGRSQAEHEKVRY